MKAKGRCDGSRQELCNLHFLIASVLIISTACSLFASRSRISETHFMLSTKYVGVVVKQAVLKCLEGVRWMCQVLGA